MQSLFRDFPSFPTIPHLSLSFDLAGAGSFIFFPLSVGFNCLSETSFLPEIFSLWVGGNCRIFLPPPSGSWEAFLTPGSLLDRGASHSGGMLFFFLFPNRGLGGGIRAAAFFGGSRFSSLLLIIRLRLELCP